MNQLFCMFLIFADAFALCKTEQENMDQNQNKIYYVDLQFTETIR